MDVIEEEHLGGDFGKGEVVEAEAETAGELVVLEGEFFLGGDDFFFDGFVELRDDHA